MLIVMGGGGVEWRGICWYVCCVACVEVVCLGVRFCFVNL